MSRILSFEAWFVVAIVWTAFVAYLGLQNAPYVPLDMGGDDAATLQAFRGALFRHAITYGLIAALPPLILLGVIGLSKRSR